MMGAAIDPGTTVGALLEAYPQAESLLVELAPPFARLRNPLVRRTVAKVTTLEQAARIGGVNLRDLIVSLRAFTGAEGSCLPEGVAVDGDNAVPTWVANCRVVKEIDAGPMLERGVHPIAMIREAFGALGPGELVRLRSPFRPQPLIDILSRAGARVHSVADGATHLTYFGK